MTRDLPNGKRYFYRGFMGNMWHGLSPTRGGISMSRGGFWHENRPCRKQKYRDFPMFQLRTHWTRPILLNPIPIIESSLVGDIPKIVPVPRAKGCLKYLKILAVSSLVRCRVLACTNTTQSAWMGDLHGGAFFSGWWNGLKHIETIQNLGGISCGIHIFLIIFNYFYLHYVS